MVEHEVQVQIEEEIGEGDGVQEVRQATQTQIGQAINTLTKTNFKELALLEIIIYRETVQPEVVIILVQTQTAQTYPPLSPIH